MKDTLTHDTEFEGHIDTATSNGGGAPTTRALKEFTTRATNSSRHVSLVWGSCRDHHRNVFFLCFIRRKHGKCNCVFDAEAIQPHSKLKGATQGSQVTVSGSSTNCFEETGWSERKSVSRDK